MTKNKVKNKFQLGLAKRRNMFKDLCCLWRHNYGSYIMILTAHLVAVTRSGVVAVCGEDIYMNGKEVCHENEASTCSGENFATHSGLFYSHLALVSVEVLFHFTRPPEIHQVTGMRV